MAERFLQVISDTDRRGAQVFATDLAEAISGLGPDVETVALVRGWSPAGLDVPVLGPRRSALSTTVELRRLARHADVVVAHGSSTLVACALGLAGVSTPVVYRQISDPLYWAGSTARRLRVGAYLRRVRTIVALSEGIAAVLRDRYRLAAERITVIPNAVPFAAFRPPTEQERAGARASLGLKGHDPLVVFVGALTVEKGVLDAVAAVAALADAHLLIAGDGPLRDEVQARGMEMAPGRVHVTGPLKQIATAYWAADVLAFPSLAGDSMPAVLIEAGLCGLPVVASDVGAVAETVEDGVTGAVVAPGDMDGFRASLASLVADVGLRREFGLRARERCTAQYTFESVGPKWIDTLRRSAERPS